MHETSLDVVAGDANDNVIANAQDREKVDNVNATNYDETPFSDVEACDATDNDTFNEKAMVDN